MRIIITYDSMLIYGCQERKAAEYNWKGKGFKRNVWSKGTNCPCY